MHMNIRIAEVTSWQIIFMEVDNAKTNSALQLLKNAPPSHLENFVTYIGTRDGVEKSVSTTVHLPSTANQKELIQDILGIVQK